jgi:amino acid adenylation domain-containing protein
MTPEQNFRELLAHAWTHSPFYRRLYTQCGIREQDLPYIPLQDLPVVSKSDVMVRFDEAVTDPRLRLEPLKSWLEQDANPLSLYLDEYVVIHSSGGSSMRSIVPCTPRTWQLITTTAAPDILPVDSGPHAPMRSAFYFVSAGHFASSTNASLASHSAHQVLWLSMLDPLEEVWAKLNAFQPERLTSYASAMAWLAEWTLEGKLQIRPRSVLVSGDRLTPYIRSLITAAWGAEIYDLYAAVESLYMAVQKPARSDFQVFTELNVLEVVDASQRMVQPGESGRIVLTNLVNRTLPLIRFDLYDEAILGKVGFGAMTLERIDGKAHMRLPVRLANGDIASLPMHDLHRLHVSGCGKVQFISHSPDEVEIHYEAQQNLDAQMETAFRTLLAAAPATVQSIRMQRVPRIHNDALTAKYWDIVTPGRPILPLVRLSDHLGAPQRSHLTPPAAARRPFSASDLPHSLWQRFQETATQYPERVAVTDGEQQLTYQECSRAARQIAQGLLQRGFAADRPVAVLCGHRTEMIPPLLGVLGAGGFYLALDPYVPLERLQTILAETQPEYMLTAAGQAEVARALAGPHTTVLRLEELLTAPPEEIRLPDLAAETPACLLYTSGSTGTPKGVLFSHKTVLHRVRQYTQDFRLCADDRLSLLQSFAVSAGVRDIFGALLNGATLAIYDVRSQEVHALPGWLNRHGISVFYAVPTLWRLFLEILSEETFASIRIVRLGGEAVQPRDLDGFKLHFPAGCLLVNGYAATETDTICQYVMDHGTDIVAQRVPVGMPVRGISVKILDDTGHDVAGAIGEIAVAGETLASGYWDPHGRQIVPLEKPPFASGDLGYQLPDGRIFLTGRRDFIVKVSGYRIHLNEIEEALSAVAGVSEAVAVSHTTPGGDTTIAVYYVLTSGSVLPPERLRRTVAAILPGPAVPISFIPLPALPRLPGGKVNRHILPHHAAFHLQPPGEDAVYHSQTEASLARIWKDVLGIRVIPAAADFFALGGDSVAAFRVLTRIRAVLHVEVPVPEFFNHSTIPELARVIDQQLATQ